jgi:hypothetical protein
LSRIGRVKIGKVWQANLEELGPVDKSKMRDIKRETLADMAEALRDYDARFKFCGYRSDSDRLRQNIHIHKHSLCGDPAAAAEAVDKADALLAEALAYDPRLCKRAQWVRGEDGIFADAGLVASGDDSPCFDRRPARLAAVADHGEPVKVVISTDGDETNQEALVSFAAVSRIVMQFRPLEIYQQGAWLNDDGTDAGYVFFVPLVSNTFDLARLQFALTDPNRDSLSFGLFAARCMLRDKHAVRGLGRHADRSYMEGAHFVPRSGIPADPADVARVAAAWLGIESAYWHEQGEKEKNGSALQSIPSTEPAYTYKPLTETEEREQEKRETKYRNERTQRMKDDAAKREQAHD